MFARFDITAILLGVKTLVFDAERNETARIARCLTRRPKNPNADQKFVVELLIRFPKDVALLDICQRGDMIQAFGNIGAQHFRNGMVKHVLSVSFLDRLLAGYSFHAFGKCMRGEKPSRSDGFETIKKGEPIPDP